MWILSAALCERRLLFIGSQIDTVTTCVLAMVGALYPFEWPHMLIPILPKKLLDYVTAPFPFIIGMKKYLLEEVRRKSLEGLVLIDLDSGECSVLGRPVRYYCSSVKLLA